MLIMNRACVRLVAGAFLGFSVYALGGSVVYAADAEICCRCHAPNDLADICLTGAAATCDDVLKTSNNPKISGFSCAGQIQAAECRSVNDGGVCASVGKAAMYSGGGGSQAAPVSQTALATPKQNVEIPGLSYSSTPKMVGGEVVIPFIAQYISAFYNYLIGAALVVASVMVVFGGFKYILGSTMSDIQGGKEIILNAVVGLVLLFSAYTILDLVNPSTAALKGLAVQVVKHDPLEDVIANVGSTTPEASAVPPKPPDVQSVGTAPSDTGEAGGTAMAPTDKVDVSGIQYDASANACANIVKYCSTRAEFSTATSFEQKQKLLARAVLGFNAVCNNQHKCVYSQASTSDLGSCKMGKGATKANFSVPRLMRSASMSLGDIFPSNPECVEAWENDKSKSHSDIIKIDACNSVASALYNEKINGRLSESGFYASDCVMFVSNIYNCAASGKWVMWGTHKYYVRAVNALAQKKKIPQEFLDAPQLVLFTNVGDPEIEAKVAQKGGVKFGDIFANLSPSLHFYMYTGGRSDVPFTFIEMGGGPPGADVPGLGHIGGSGIRNMTWRENIQNLAAKNKDYTIMIWRPFADTAPAASSPSP